MKEAKAKKINIGSKDIISKLPEELLHRILCHLDQKTAIRTCVLSKVWRHLGCTRPKIDIHFREDDSTDSPAFLGRILHHRKNLRLDEFTIQLSKGYVDCCGVDTASLLNKWIPVIIHDMRVGIFSLYLDEVQELIFQVPSLSLIFQSPHIRFISLMSCSLSSTSYAPAPDLKLILRSLILYEVYIPEEILDNILSNCPLITNVHLSYCKGFSRIKAFMNNNNNNNLAHFYFRYFELDDIGVEIEDGISIEIGGDIQTLASIKLATCLFSVSPKKPFEYASLKRLSLTRVRLSCESFSCNLHGLEELKLKYCSGIKEFKLSSRSMKRLVIHNISKSFKAAIDAPSIVSFHYMGILPRSISFGTTSDEWKSNIILGSSVGHIDRWFNEVYGLLEALSQSEMTLVLDQDQVLMLGTQLQIGDIDDIVGVSEEAKHELPVVVEHLQIKRSDRNEPFNAAPFLNLLFHLFRPSFVYMGTDMLTCSNYKRSREIAELLFKERETIHESYIWERVLEEVSLQVLYKNQSKWKLVKHKSFTKLSKKVAETKEVELRFHLKWRD